MKTLGYKNVNNLISKELVEFWTHKLTLIIQISWVVLEWYAINLGTILIYNDIKPFLKAACLTTITNISKKSIECIVK